MNLGAQLKISNFTGEIYPVEKMKYNISGHEKFACRYFWLKKGYDFIESGGSFNNEEALIGLGVGKNMVNSIRHWIKSFGFLTKKDSLLFKDIFNDEGFDPFLEDTNTFWLLHYLLIKQNYASIYSLFFNNFHIRTEFSIENFKYYLKRKFEDDQFEYSENTLENDLKVFENMYIKPRKSKKSLEDDFSGLFQELEIFTKISNDQIVINNSEQKNISPFIILFILYDRYKNQNSISFNNMFTDENSIGRVFCLTQSTLFNIIENLVSEFDFLVFTEDAGIRELQFKSKPINDKYELLKLYYNAN